ncbi:hypothetical protein B0H10DRAFT_1956372 [Mycena sp. CBHHK59/15]|nr:hypothetical protein B0H10DRAFT_1956372 [Mycena sp. CBHHK59/15]
MSMKEQEQEQEEADEGKGTEKQWGMRGTGRVEEPLALHIDNQGCSPAMPTDCRRMGEDDREVVQDEKKMKKIKKIETSDEELNKKKPIWIHLAHLGSGEVVGIEGVHAMELIVGREEHDCPPPAVLMIVFVAMGFHMSSVGHLAGIQVALVLDLMDSVLTQQHIAVMLKVVQHCVKPSLTLLAFGGEVVVHGWVHYIIPYNVQHALGPPKSGLANTHYIAHTTNAPEWITHVIPRLDPAVQGQAQQCQHYGGNSVP